MERHFEEELNILKERLLYMGKLAEEGLHHAIEGLLKRDTELLKKAIGHEDEINKLHIEIDERCIRLLALRQPMAVDLRFITAAMKINSDLERIGDHAVNISQDTEKLFKKPEMKLFEEISQMSEMVQQMVKDSLDAFIRKDEHIANNVLLIDNEVDELKNQIFKQVVKYMEQNTSVIEQNLDFILIARNLEKIGDHATNIAEDVIFMVVGKDIRHHTNIT